MPNSKQDQDFAQMMTSDHVDEIKISKTALDGAIEWIAGNLNPDEVFSDKDLESWAEANGYTKEDTP